MIQFWNSTQCHQMVLKVFSRHKIRRDMHNFMPITTWHFGGKQDSIPIEFVKQMEINNETIPEPSCFRSDVLDSSRHNIIDRLNMYWYTLIREQSLHWWFFLRCYTTWKYRKTSSISRTKSQSLNVSCILLQVSSLNPLKPGVKLIMKM